MLVATTMEPVGRGAGLVARTSARLVGAVGTRLIDVGIGLTAGVGTELSDGGGPIELAGISVELIDGAPVELVGIGVGLTGSIGVGLATAEGTECLVAGVGATLDTVGMGAEILGVGATTELPDTGVGLAGSIDVGSVAGVCAGLAGDVGEELGGAGAGAVALGVKLDDGGVCAELSDGGGPIGLVGIGVE